jgi:Cu/Ag efflux pump CusA
VVALVRESGRAELNAHAEGVHVTEYVATVDPGSEWTREMVVRGGQDRLAPVLMTALTSGIGLMSLALAAGKPGKEILYPQATVIINGLVTSTLLEFLVRPALFWTWGLKAAQRVVEASEQQVELIAEEEKPARD